MATSAGDDDLIRSDASQQGIDRQAQGHASERGGHAYGPITVGDGQAHFGNNYYTNVYQNDQSTFRILDSLYYPEMNARRNEIKEARYETFEWVFQPNTDAPGQLAEWLSSAAGMYLIQGKAGSGKSTFAKFVSDHDKTKELLSKWAPDGFLILFHGFWLAGSKIQHSLKGVLASLAYQLIESNPDLATICADLIDKRRPRSVNDWSEESLRKLVIQSVASSKLKMAIFIDGLDEFDHQDDFDRLLIFLQTLQKYGCKLCMSTRPIPHILRVLENLPGLCLHNLTEHDIRQYVENMLREKTALLAHTADHISRLADVMCRKAEGVFVWVYYVLQNVCIGIRSEEGLETLLRRVESLPSSMIELYRGMLAIQNVDNAVHRGETTRLLRLVKYMPLNLFQLTICMDPDLLREYATDFSPIDPARLQAKCLAMKARITILSAGMITYLQNNITMTYGDSGTLNLGRSEALQKTMETTIVHPFHRTVRDYLNGTEDGKILLGENSGDCQEILLAVVVAKLAHFVQQRGLPRYFSPQFSVEFILMLLRDLHRATNIFDDDPELQLCNIIGSFYNVHDTPDHEITAYRQHWAYRIYTQERGSSYDKSIGHLGVPGMIVDSLWMAFGWIDKSPQFSQYLQLHGQAWSHYFRVEVVLYLMKISRGSENKNAVPLLSQVRYADYLIPHTSGGWSGIFVERSLILQILKDTVTRFLDSKHALDRYDSYCLDLLSTFSSYLTMYEITLAWSEESKRFESNPDRLTYPDNTHVLLKLPASPTFSILSSLVEQSTADRSRTVYTSVRQLPLEMFIYNETSSQTSGVFNNVRFGVPFATQQELLLDHFERRDIAGDDNVGLFDMDELWWDSIVKLWQDHLPLSISTLVPDFIFARKGAADTFSPVDPQQEVTQENWKQYCNMRHHYAGVDVDKYDEWLANQQKSDLPGAGSRPTATKTDTEDLNEMKQSDRVKQTNSNDMRPLSKWKRKLTAKLGKKEK